MSMIDPDTRAATPLRRRAAALLALASGRGLPVVVALVAIGVAAALLLFRQHTVSDTAERRVAEIERRAEVAATDDTRSTSEPAPDTEALPDIGNIVREHAAEPREEGLARGVGALEALTKRLERLSTGAALPPIAPDALRELLPEELPGGYRRSETAVSETGVQGMNMATATGTYGNGGKRLTLTLSDMGAAGAIAGLAGIFGATTTEEEAGVTRSMSAADGRVTTEEFDANRRSGLYGVMVADRVMVKAEGTDIGDTSDLKAAVDSVDIRRVEALARK